MDWNTIAERFDRNDASTDEELGKYLLDRPEAGQLAKLPRVTILGARGSGKSALLRSMGTSYGTGYTVVRVTFDALEKLSREIGEAPGVRPTVDEIKENAVFFWVISTVASLSKGHLIFGDEKTVRGGGIELGLQGRDFVESISESVGQNMTATISLLGEALGTEIPVPKKGKRSPQPLRPFKLLRRLTPALKKILATKKIAFQVDEIDGEQAELTEIATSTTRYSESLHRLCTGRPTVKYALAMNPVIWDEIRRRAANPKTFGKRRWIRDWSPEQLWRIWRLRVDPLVELSDEAILSLVPLGEAFQTREFNPKEQVLEPSVFGCRGRPRTLIDLWRLVFEHASLEEQSTIPAIGREVWSEHLSSTAEDILMELSLGIGGVEQLLEFLKEEGAETLTEQSLERLIDGALGRISGTVSPWLRLRPQRLLEQLEKSGLAVRCSAPGRTAEWYLRRELLA